MRSCCCSRRTAPTTCPRTRAAAVPPGTSTRSSSSRPWCSTSGRPARRTDADRLRSPAPAAAPRPGARAGVPDPGGARPTTGVRAPRDVSASYVVEGDPAADARAPAGCRVHAQRAAEGADAVGHVHEAVALPRGAVRIEPGAGVGHREQQRALLLVQVDDDRRALPRVLARVLER